MLQVTPHYIITSQTFAQDWASTWWPGILDPCCRLAAFASWPPTYLETGFVVVYILLWAADIGES